MRYLKLFENFNDSRFVEYIPGTRSDNDKRFLIGNAEIFSKKEIDKVKELLNKYGVTEFEQHLPSTLSFWMPYKDVKSTKKYIGIESFKDEWYLVKDHPFFYECDQIDGVINCLKSLLPK